MSKLLTGGALISYGSTLPNSISTPDGTLFYKVDSSGNKPQGLYIYGIIGDTDLGQLGSQVGQGWMQVSAVDTFVLKAGDVMTGTLQVPNVLKVSATNNKQRILIGNQDSGGTNKPGIIEGVNSSIFIGHGSNWADGGTLTSGLGINASSATSGLTWFNQQVWHAGNDGAGSGLDADLFAGQNSSYYLNLGNSAFTGTLPIVRGGTGSTSVVTGGVAYGASSTSYGFTVAGSAGQVLLSNGNSSPTWANQSSLNVGNATYAATAGSATSATTASTANAVAWTGITGLNATPSAGSSSVQIFSDSPNPGVVTLVRPSYFYRFPSSASAATMQPTKYLAGSVSGFDAYQSSDIGQYFVGITVMGGSSGDRAVQIAANWNFEEAAPTGGLKYRVNDDTTDVSNWGAFRTIWDQGNLNKVSQLTNDANYVSAGSNISQFANDAGYVTSGGATGGGNDKVFWENDTVITTSYTITAGKNAMTAGPVTINNGVTVTVPNGSTWTII